MITSFIFKVFKFEYLVTFWSFGFFLEKRDGTGDKWIKIASFNEGI